MLADSAANASADDDLAAPAALSVVAGGGAAVTAAARSVLVPAEHPRQLSARSAADPALLGLLARAAGIAPEWWDVDGKHTIVSDDTRRALLAAMRLPATTAGEARDALRQISDTRDRRAVPLAVVAHGDTPAVLPIGLEPGLGRRPLWLTIEREDGETQRVRVGAEDGTLAVFDAADGLPTQTWRVALPALPVGRHRLWRDDAPELVCHLTVAPRRCHLPEVIARGGRRFGIAAQLYSLRRVGDQGIGDFTTLGQFAMAAKREGAATVGINPLHMLFPDQRERASPYHPSDRRFLDPIYLDVADDGFAGGAESDMEAAPALPCLPADRADPVSGNDTVAYTKVWALKRAILERRFAAFTDRDRNDPAAGRRFGGSLPMAGPRCIALRHSRQSPRHIPARPGSAGLPPCVPRTVTQSRPSGRRAWTVSGFTDTCSSWLTSNSPPPRPRLLDWNSACSVTLLSALRPTARRLGRVPRTWPRGHGPARR